MREVMIERQFLLGIGTGFLSLFQIPYEKSVGRFQ
jgi:hypothetical protein